MMLRNILLVSPLLLLTCGVSYGVGIFDVQVCEAHTSEDQKIKCYRGLLLNPSCHTLKKTKQLACFRRSVQRTLLGTKENAAPEQATPPNPKAAFFAQPERLCSALSPIGLDTSEWKLDKSSVDQAWSCASHPTPSDSVGSNKSNSDLKYRVYGNTSTQANRIDIVSDIHDSSNRKQALNRLEAAARVLFKAISQHLPIDLIMAIRHQTPVSIPTDFGTVELIRESGEKESYTIALNKNNVGFDQNQLQSTATREFESCKKVTARAAGYPAYMIFGNGVPTQKSGYKSYRLRGRGMDWFNCNVYPGGKYIVEAAIGGKYPPNKIAQGSFLIFAPDDPTRIDAQ